MEDSTSQPSYSFGFPNPALGSAKTPLDLNQLVIRNPASTFYVQMQGSAGEKLGVNDRDILVVDRAVTPKKNDTLILAVDGELVLSKAKNLKKLNNAQVWGVVTWIVRSLGNPK